MTCNNHKHHGAERNMVNAMEAIAEGLIMAGFDRTEGEAMFYTLGRLLTGVRKGEIHNDENGKLKLTTILLEELRKVGLLQEKK